jgi:subtilisin family serine protease
MLRSHARRLRVGVAVCALVASGAAGAVTTAANASTADTTGPTQTYLVLYSTGTSTAGAATSVASAGGSVVANYPQISVVIARSNSTAFAATISRAANVAGVSATGNFGVQINDGQDTTADTADATPVPAPASSGEPLAPLQWDMAQIHAFAAHQINGGNPSVVVGDIDTGLDFTHPDLAPNYRPAQSADCTSGAPAPLLPGNDHNGHGTHTAGTIAAAVNGIGITGVAPNVGIAGIKAGNDAGFFFPEAVVCAFMWAGTHGINVTNNSYFADPWLFNCRNDATQRAIWTAERRAIAFAQSRGTVVVAAEGNQADDLSHPTVDATSPDDTTPVTRAITNACATVPVEVPGVIGVTATGNRELKSFYSSYGISTADVAAPGGDSILQRTPAAPNGRVLSTWPAALIGSCARKIIDGVSGATYCYLQGTSMAAPHATGVAALLLSRGVAPRAVEAAMQASANPLPCPPDLSIYAFFPAVDGGAPQVCTGAPDHNSFYGAGEIDALKAVS